MATTEGSGEEEYSLPITSDGVVRIAPRLRERYLTEDVDFAVVQATGDYLTIRVWSGRKNVKVSIPFDGYRAERPYKRAINSWGINVNRWTTVGKGSRENGKTGWWNDATIEIGYGGNSGKPMVSATVETFEGDQPDV